MTLHKKLKRGKISLDCRFLLKVFLSRGLCHSFSLLQNKITESVQCCYAAGMLVLTNQNNFSRYSIWEVLLFLATHIVPRAAVCTRLSSRFKFQVRHLNKFLKYPRKLSKDSKILIFHFHCWKSNDYLCRLCIDNFTWTKQRFFFSFFKVVL